MVTPKDAGSKPPRAPRPSKPLARTGKPLTAPEDTPAELVLPEAAPPSLADVLLVRPDGKPAGVVVYFSTEDVEETLHYLKVERIGGARKAIPSPTYVSKDVIAGLGHPRRIRITIEAADQ
jgi:hypothetical protein